MDSKLQLLEMKINKNNFPQWFSPIYKTLLNKNITITDWNILMKYITYCVSDINTVYDFIEDSANEITSISEEWIEENLV